MGGLCTAAGLGDPAGLKGAAGTKANGDLPLAAASRAENVSCGRWTAAGLATAPQAPQLLPSGGLPTVTALTGDRLPDSLCFSNCCPELLTLEYAVASAGAPMGRWTDSHSHMAAVPAQ